MNNTQTLSKKTGNLKKLLSFKNMMECAGKEACKTVDLLKMNGTVLKTIPRK